MKFVKFHDVKLGSLLGGVILHPRDINTYCNSYHNENICIIKYGSSINDRTHKVEIRKDRVTKKYLDIYKKQAIAINILGKHCEIGKYIYDGNDMDLTWEYCELPCFRVYEIPSIDLQISLNATFDINESDDNMGSIENRTVNQTMIQYVDKYFKILKNVNDCSEDEQNWFCKINKIDNKTKFMNNVDIITKNNDIDVTFKYNFLNKLKIM